MVDLIKRTLTKLLIYNSVVCLSSHVKLHNMGIIVVLPFTTLGLHLIVYLKRVVHGA